MKKILKAILKNAGFVALFALSINSSLKADAGKPAEPAESTPVSTSTTNAASSDDQKVAHHHHHHGKGKREILKTLKTELADWRDEDGSNMSLQGEYAKNNPSGTTAAQPQAISEVVALPAEGDVLKGIYANIVNARTNKTTPSADDKAAVKTALKKIADDCKRQSGQLREILADIELQSADQDAYSYLSKEDVKEVAHELFEESFGYEEHKRRHEKREHKKDKKHKDKKDKKHKDKKHHKKHKHNKHKHDDKDDDKND